MAHVWTGAARRIRVGAGRAVDLVLPPLALDDQQSAGTQSLRRERPQTPGLSARAWERIAFIDGPLCDGCGAPYPYDVGVGVLCPACSTRVRLISRTRAACLYDDHSRDLILKLKHADRTDLAPLFARWLSRAAAELLEHADLICPVPLHRRRLLARRYNQAAEIARPLAVYARKLGAGAVYAPDLLVRSRATPTQGGKSGRGRRENVRNAFAVSKGGAAKVAGKRVLLVDDVLTTGATADACARALLRAGAAAVDLAVVARVRESGTEPI
jgi:ComF family protein